MRSIINAATILLLVVAVCATRVAYASSQIADDKTVIQITSYGTRAMITFSPPESNSEGCANANSDRTVVILLSDDNMRAMLANLMAAAHAGKLVGFGLTGCYDNNLPLVYRVDVNI